MMFPRCPHLYVILVLLPLSTCCLLSSLLPSTTSKEPDVTSQFSCAIVKICTASTEIIAEFSSQP